MRFLKPVSIFCNICFLALGIFQVGALYGAHPYRKLAGAGASRLELTQINLSQSHTLYIVACITFGFALTNLVTLLLLKLGPGKQPLKT